MVQKTDNNYANESNFSIVEIASNDKLNEIVEYSFSNFDGMLQKASSLLKESKEKYVYNFVQGFISTINMSIQFIEKILIKFEREDFLLPNDLISYNKKLENIRKTVMKITVENNFDKNKL